MTATAVDRLTETVGRVWDRAWEIELEADAGMALAAKALGKDKCVVVGCMTLIGPEHNRDGFCSFHRPRREERA